MNNVANVTHLRANLEIKINIWFYLVLYLL